MALASASLAFAGDPVVLPDFSDLSLDELANVKVTSFTKKPQSLSQVAGAVYVITQEQIERSGLTSVPELLRLAPGVDVAQVNGNQWSVSIRGPIGVYSNKLLVLIDGRSIYSSVFAGVYWELGMPLLEDIERIEVIRGPGATIWGANAVLGVINIITKSSRETHGTTVTAGVGSAERTLGSVGLGGANGSINYRGYFGGSDNAALSQLSGASANDGWSSVQGGFRLDGQYGKSAWLLEGDVSRAADTDIGAKASLANQNFVLSPASFKSMAANLTAEWRRRFGNVAELRIQSYFDYANRPVPQAPEVETRTFDTEAQYDFRAGHLQNISVGGGVRLISDEIDTDGEIAFRPAALTYANLNGFAQDEMHFARDTVMLTLGAKLEHNYFGGWGPEPSVNLLWMPTKQHSLWVSAARPLRTPSLFDIGGDIPVAVHPASPATFGLPVLGSIAGSAGFSNEAVKDFEAGYRGQISRTLSLDLTAFYDRLSNLRSFATGDRTLVVTPIPHWEITGLAGNVGEATGKGGEGSIAWQASRAWKLEGSHTYYLGDTWLSASASPQSVYGGGKPRPRNNWRLQSYANLSRSLTLDGFIYWTSSCNPLNAVGPDSVIYEA